MCVSGVAINHDTTGMAFSFATTYALGQPAKRYYAGGRVMKLFPLIYACVMQ